MSISFLEFEKALNSLEQALLAPKNDISRDATIQRFEFCVELAWKSSKKSMGTATTAPKQVIREMAQNKLIDDVEFWLDAIEKRNLSAHTYNETLAEQVYNFAQVFLPEGIKLLKNLQN